MRRISEMPPILVTLGCATSSAPSSNARRNSINPAAFSPAAITAPAARTFASPA